MIKNEIQRFENEFLCFEFRDGILFGRYKVNKMDLEMARAGTAYRIKVMQGKKVPAVADISSIKHIDKDAREFITSSEGGKDLAALAVVIKNPVNRILSSFLMKFNPPEYPFRFFNNVEEATQWIKETVKE